MAKRKPARRAPRRAPANTTPDALADALPAIAPPAEKFVLTVPDIIEALKTASEDEIRVIRRTIGFTAADVIDALLNATRDQTRLIRDLVAGSTEPFRYPQDYGAKLAEILAPFARPATYTLPPMG
jgi:hypothetical protein